jgi:hypothetical protein
LEEHRLRRGFMQDDQARLAPKMVRMKTMASEMTKHHMSVKNIIMKKKSAEKIIMKKKMPTKKIMMKKKIPARPR